MITIARTLPALLLASSFACDGRSLAPELPAVGSSELALSRRMLPGGPPQPVGSFPATVYGASFVRVMKDGTIYYGKPTAVFTRHLDPDALNELLAAWAPESLGVLASSYDLNSRWCAEQGISPCGVVGNPTTEVYRLEGVAMREVMVMNGTVDELAAWDGLVPAKLLAAARTLEGIASGGERWRASAFLLQAEVDTFASSARDWPVRSLSLAAIASATPTLAETLTVDAAPIVAELHELFSNEEVPFATFREAGKTYMVGLCPILPGAIVR
ncbi:MAG: hypothetical protein QG573_71 [Acidobacteriota bacterium]|nr:hypothetical protein [Acidobacteriota bacterium]